MPPFLYLLIMKHSHSYYLKNLTPFGRILYFIKVARFYANGDGTGILFNYWNPIGYPLMMYFLFASILLHGIIETKRTMYQMGFVMDPYFVEHPEELWWI